MRLDMVGKDVRLMFAYTTVVEEALVSYTPRNQQYLCASKSIISFIDLQKIISQCCLASICSYWSGGWSCKVYASQPKGCGFKTFIRLQSIIPHDTSTDWFQEAYLTVIYLSCENLPFRIELK